MTTHRRTSQIHSRPTIQMEFLQRRFTQSPRSANKLFTTAVSRRTLVAERFSFKFAFLLWYVYQLCDMAGCSRRQDRQNGSTRFILTTYCSNSFLFCPREDRMRSIATSMFVRLSVSLSARISRKPHGGTSRSFGLWRRCGTLDTSDFVDDVMFSRTGPHVCSLAARS